MSESTSSTSQAAIVLITGVSGAGRTTASKIMEDLGYVVIDNMPPQLLPAAAKLMEQREIDKMAVVLDIRSYRFINDFTAFLSEVDTTLPPITVVFLEADDDVLIQRFNAVKRAHPLGGNVRIAEAITQEREIMAALRTQADLIVDTTHLNVYQFRDKLQHLLQEDDSHGMITNVVSFGFKHGIPDDADLVFDVRFLLNPHWVKELRPLTGLDKPVADYVLKQDLAKEFISQLHKMLNLLVPAFQEEGKRYLTIAIGCTGGNHRSVAMAEEIAGFLRGQDLSVRVTHRDRSIRV